MLGVSLPAGAAALSEGVDLAVVVPLGASEHAATASAIVASRSTTSNRRVWVIDMASLL
jgi:hypothetical protein